MIRNLRFLLITGLSLLAWGTVVGAEVKTFGPFSVDVPAGWETDYEGDCLTMVNLNPKTMLMACRIALDGQSVATAVQEVAKTFNAEPEKDRHGGYYGFEFKNEALDLDVTVTADEEDGHLILIGLGWHHLDGAHPEVWKLLTALDEQLDPVKK